MLPLTTLNCLLEVKDCPNQPIKYSLEGLEYKLCYNNAFLATSPCSGQLSQLANTGRSRITTGFLLVTKGIGYLKLLLSLG